MASSRWITGFTEEQETIIREMGKDWDAVDWATGPGDRAAAEDGVRAVYRGLGLPPPRFIVWLGSPWAGLIGQAVLPGIIASVTGGRLARVRARFRRRIRGQLRTRSKEFLHPEIYDRVEAQVTPAADKRVVTTVVEEQSPGQTWRMVAQSAMVWPASGRKPEPWSQPRVQDELAAQVATQADISPVPEMPLFRLPQRWRYEFPQGSSVTSFAWADAMELIGVTGLDPLHAQRQVTRHAGLWWAYRDYAVLTPRPDVLRRDAQGRLHCADGPAAVWPDGWVIHAWHGREVPGALIDGCWDAARILQEDNSEIRRAAIERMGWAEFIAAAGLRQVGSSEPDPGNPGYQLALYDLPTGSMLPSVVRVLLCTNASPERDGTRRQYGLIVPVDAPDPVTAAAGMLGLTREQYLTLARAT
ncbi:hypothetical protein OG607_44325 [Streptomyces sp. NBC_01537]|uniref:DUF6745 domain-containing protein n=1 Tax=Streptomyces sp. NBC_01537 TaxID=2903896 RepID=UPI00386729F0